MAEVVTSDGRVDFLVDENRSRVRLIIEKKNTAADILLSLEEAQQFVNSLSNDLRLVNVNSNKVKI